MSRSAQAHVKDRRYKLTGSFHEPGAHSPILDQDQGRKLLGVTNPRSMVYLHSYGGEAIFFESLGAAQLLGTRCDNPVCDSLATIYLPFRIHCPDCLARCTVTELTDRARRSACVHTFMICERSGAFSPLETPIRFINIAIDGVATILMSYLSVGEPEIGLRVVPIFRTCAPTYTITDLSWVAEGTGQDELPAGFSF